MRVLLVQPPLQPGREVAPPLGLCTLASWLISIGHEASIFDLDLECKCASSASRLTYSDLLAARLKEFHPAVVGVTSMYNNSLQAQRLVETVKRTDSTIVTIGGGSHFGALGLQSLRRIPELDFVIEGEGELAFAGLLESLERTPLGVPGVCHRTSTDVSRNPPGPLFPLSDLPPIWSTLGSSALLHRYSDTVPKGAARRLIYIEAGRGCPFACSFCATSPFWQRRYRVKPIHRLVDEIRFLHEEFKYDSFVLVHDLLTVDRQFMSDFCDAMQQAQLPVEWMANSRTDISLGGLLPKMKLSGCWKLFLGIESASSRIQANIEKNLVPAEAFAAVRDLLANGISATCSFVIGFKDESLPELSSTIDLATQMKLLGVETIQFHRLRLWPPAPLSLTGLHTQFDEDSLRIEYPFAEVPAEDIETIRADPIFFEGYFAPESNAGTAAQLAQVEMLFQHAVGLAPLTIAALSNLLEEDLISSFYKALLRSRPLARENLDWESGNLFGNWLAILPLLTSWVSEAENVTEWQRELLTGTMEYEGRRLRFVGGMPLPANEILCSGENWIAFATPVNLNKLMESLLGRLELTQHVMDREIVILVQKPPEKFTAFLLESRLRAKLETRCSQLSELLGLHGWHAATGTSEWDPPTPLT
jgi:radical SAM superfamily enzyme YgiQ (UPF0313 family)